MESTLDCHWSEIGPISRDGGKQLAFWHIGPNTHNQDDFRRASAVVFVKIVDVSDQSGRLCQRGRRGRAKGTGLNPAPTGC